MIDVEKEIKDFNYIGNNNNFEKFCSLIRRLAKERDELNFKVKKIQDKENEYCRFCFELIGGSMGFGGWHAMGHKCKEAAEILEGKE